MFSRHADNSVSNEGHSKSLMIMDHNRTKEAVDDSDKLIRKYYVAGELNVGLEFYIIYIRIFMNMVDIAALNAFIIFIQKNPEWNLLNDLSSRRKQLLLDLRKN